MTDRREFIGGSDIAAVMGVSPWKTPLQLWAEKTGEVDAPDLSDNEAVQMGIALEDPVAQIFSKKTGMTVRRAPGNYELKGYPYIRCQVDRLITGTDELLEVKTCSLRSEDKWSGEEIPVEYILQVQWQLMITGRAVGWIAVLIGGQKFVYKKITPDKEIQDKMLLAAISFWDMVQRKIPPVAESDDNPFMVKLFPSAGPEIAEASADITSAIKLLQQTKAEIINAEKVKDELEARLKAAIGDLQGLKTPEYTAKWINVKGSTFQVTKADSRQLRITKNKGV